MKRELILFAIIIVYLSSVYALDAPSSLPKFPKYSDVYIVPNASEIYSSRFLENTKTLIVIGSKSPVSDYMVAKQVSEELESLTNLIMQLNSLKCIEIKASPIKIGKKYELDEGEGFYWLNDYFLILRGEYRENKKDPWQRLNIRVFTNPRYGIDGYKLMVKENITYKIKPQIKLDAEITPKEKAEFNLILIGGSIANSLTKELESQLPIPVTNDYPAHGKGTIQLLRDPWGSGNDVLVVAGSDRESTRKAALALSDMISLKKTELNKKLASFKTEEEVRIGKYKIKITGVSEKYGVMIEIIEDGKTVARDLLIPTCDEREGLVYGDIYVEAANFFVSNCL